MKNKKIWGSANRYKSPENPTGFRIYIESFGACALIASPWSAGYPSDATESAGQAGIVAAGYH